MSLILQHLSFILWCNFSAAFKNKINLFFFFFFFFFFFHVKIIIIAHNVDLSIQSQISKQKSEKDEITAEKERHNDEANEEVRTLILIV